MVEREDAAAGMTRNAPINPGRRASVPMLLKNEHTITKVVGRSVPQRNVVRTEEDGTNTDTAQPVANVKWLFS